MKDALAQDGLPLAEAGAAITNRFHNIIYWLRYLGFVVQTGDRLGEGLIPDPTLFLRRHLDELVPAGEDMEIHRFISVLGTICPVLDGGAVRRRLLTRIAAEWPENQVSDSLAFALERLDRSKELRVWCPDDQRTFMVTPAGKKLALSAQPMKTPSHFPNVVCWDPASRQRSYESDRATRPRVDLSRHAFSDSDPTAEPWQSSRRRRRRIRKMSSSRTFSSRGRRIFFALQSATRERANRT